MKLVRKQTNMCAELTMSPPLLFTVYSHVARAAELTEGGRKTVVVV